MVQTEEIKRLDRDSKIENIVEGEIVEIVGINSKDQREKARIEHFDSVANLVLVGTRVSAESVELSTYFITPFGVKQGTVKQTYSKPSPQFEKYDALLKEAGI